MMRKALTIVITFSNEADLLRMTVENIFSTMDSHLTEILLIDDASTDHYDYQSLAVEFGARYHRNSTKKGIARSREIGIALCDSKFFLLLDGHMKALTEYWDRKLLDYGINAENQLYCCQTASIDKYGSLIKERQQSFGAYINPLDLLVKWNYKEHVPTDSVELVPCVLGGAYFCSRAFWQSFGGLCGLDGYGFDEQVMSMRVWRNRGKCVLIKDVCFGHYYRNTSDTPYEIDKINYTQNRVFSSRIFFSMMDLCELSEINNLGDCFVSIKEFCSLNQSFLNDNV